MDAILILMRVNILTSCILIPIIGLIHLGLIEKSLKTTIPVTAKIITAYSKYLCSRKNITTDLSKARYITVEVDSKCYTIQVRERLSRNQKEILVYTDGEHAVMYSEKKWYIYQKDQDGLFLPDKLQKIFTCVSIIIILVACGETYYIGYSKDLKTLQNIYVNKVDTYIDNDSPDEQTATYILFYDMITSGHKSVITCLIDIEAMDVLLANDTDALADNRVKLSHPVWNSVLKKHYSQLDSGTWNNKSSYEKSFWIAEIYCHLLFVLTILSILYLIAVCATIIYRKILMRREI